MQADQTVLSLRPGGGGNRGSRVLASGFGSSALSSAHGGAPSSFSFKTGDSWFEGRERVRYTRDQLLQIRGVGNTPDNILKIKQEIEAEFFGEDQNWSRGESNLQNQSQSRTTSGEERSWETLRENREFGSQFNRQDQLNSQFSRAQSSVAAGVAVGDDQGGRRSDSQKPLHMEPAANMGSTGNTIGKDGKYTVTHLPCGSVRLSREGRQDVVLGLDLFDGVGKGKHSRLLGILRTRPTTFLNLGGMAVFSRRLVLKSLCSFLKALETITLESASGEDFRAIQHGLERLKADGLQVRWLEEHIVQVNIQITLGLPRSKLGEVRFAILEQQATLALLEEKEITITGQIRELEAVVSKPLDLAGKGLGV